MNKETKTLILYRINRSEETLDDAKILFKNKKLFSTVNRIYYALFYSVNALLLTKGLSSAKHSGVLALFNKHFINENIIDKNIGGFYTNMFEFRQKADYKDLIEFEKEDIQVWLEKAEIFIHEIKKAVSKF